MQVNTPRIATPCIVRHVSTLRSERLKAARLKAGYESAADAARANGWPEPRYRHHENGTRSFGADAAKKYGRAFKVRPGWLLGIENVQEAVPEKRPEPDTLSVQGTVAAGVWREPGKWDEEHGFEITGSQSPIPAARRFGLQVEGKSMDLVYDPGTILDCISIFDVKVNPTDGDHVIVERVRPDGLRELTVKEFLEEDGRYFLVPRSSRPEFQERIEIGFPSLDHIGDDGIRVIAFVVGSYPPRAIDLMRRIGVIKP